MQRKSEIKGITLMEIEDIPDRFNAIKVQETIFIPARLKEDQRHYLIQRCLDKKGNIWTEIIGAPKTCYVYWKYTKEMETKAKRVGFNMELSPNGKSL